MPKIGNIILPDFPLLLAPMEDVSDPPFRRLCKLHGADLMYSEFISSEGLIRDAMKSRMKLDIFDYERPVGIQIFGGDEEAMEMSSRIVDAVQPDLVDINFGCPVKKVVCKGAGAGVLKDVDLMVRLTKAVIKGTSLPVTVKTRSDLLFRPHHFLCTLAFEGKGYSASFIESYDDIAHSLRDSPAGEETVIEVTNFSDSICAPCPNRRGARCDTNSKITDLDAGHARVLGLKHGDQLTWGEAKDRLRTHMTVELHHRICAPCGWRTLGVCEKALRYLRGESSP